MTKRLGLKLPAIALLAIAPSACQTMAGQGCVGGAILGAGIGALVGSNTGQAAAIGAGAGCLVGSQFGRYVEDRRRGYASDEAFLDDEIQSTSAYNQQLDVYASTLETEVASLDTEIANLMASYEENNATNQQLLAKKNELDNLNSSVNAQLAEAESQLENKKQVLAYIESTSSAGRSRQLRTEIAQLETSIARLRGEATIIADNSSRLQLR